MTGLEELKDVMHTPPDFEPVPLDLAVVMAHGGRLRRRRRLVMGGAAATAVTVVLLGGNLLTSAGHPTNAAAGVQPLPSAKASDITQPDGVPSAINSSAPGVLGNVVKTGRWVEGRQWVLYAETVNPKKMHTNLTLVLGRTKTGYIDDFKPEIIGTDHADQDRFSPGFHAVTAATVRNGRTTPVFGYYAGDAARITARDTRTGRTVEAHRTAWSDFGGPAIAQIFWFDFQPGQAPAGLTGLAAYDGNGTELPAGKGNVIG
jgi:hypothetical protein